MKIFNILARNFSVDLRSLAITRMAFGALLLVDIFIRSRFLKDFYTDEGVLNLYALKGIYEGNYYTSVHALSGDYYFQLFLFLVAVVFAFFLFIGFFTRVAAVISWALLVSLNLRNPLLLHGGDIIFRCLLFWGIFTPWAERFSVDSYFRKNKTDKNFIFSVAATAFILQILFMYFFTGLLKTGDPWREDFTAIYYALSIEHFSFLLGPYIYQFPQLMKGLTFSIIWFELLGPFLLLIPFRNSLFRYIFIGLVVSFQLGLALTMKIGLFPWFSMASVLILLPSSFWDFVPKLQLFLQNIFSKLSAGIKFYINGIGNWLYYRLEIPRFLKAAINILLIFLIISVVFWNLKYSYKDTFSFVNNITFVMKATQLKQKWNMFAPKPYRADGWYVIVGLLDNGEIVDIFRNGKEVSWDPPENRLDDYSSYRWRKISRNVYKEKNKRFRRFYAKYLCNKWNNIPDGPKLLEMDMYFVSEYTLTDYKFKEHKINKRYSYECRIKK